MRAESVERQTKKKLYQKAYLNRASSSSQEQEPGTDEYTTTTIGTEEGESLNSSNHKGGSYVPYSAAQVSSEEMMVNFPNLIPLQPPEDTTTNGMYKWALDGR